ncbi:MAG: tetratricopeptide repeat protein [Bacteroidota bacterium]
MHKRIRLVTLFLFGVAAVALGQEQEKSDEAKALKKNLRDSKDLTWQANKELTANDFQTAEADYRRAISKSKENAAAPYNLGNAYYDRESYAEAFSRFKQAGEKSSSKTGKHKSFHNMGNVFMKRKEYQKAVEAYKQALRNNPTDDETRYNLALAKEMLKKEQDDQKNDQNQNDKDKNEDKQDQDKNKDQDNKGEDNKDNEGENEEDEKNKDGDEGEQGQNKPEENQKGDGDKKKEKEQKPNQGDKGEKSEQQPRPNQLSKQQIQNLLEAMQNEEKKVQQKMEAKKIKGKKIKNEKDW